jgi:hypothetical protein
MNSCKNPECNEMTQGNKIYCSLKCRNVYVNKYIRNYDKISKILSDKTRLYYVSKQCKKCGIDLSYEKRNNIFCSRKCADSTRNVGRVYTNETKIKQSIATTNWNLKHNRNVGQKRKCKECDIEFSIKRNSGKRFCSHQCRIEFGRKHLSEYKKYRLECKFKFKLFDFPDEFDLKLIKEFGIYKAKNRGDNLDGISRDHMYSVYDGFKNKIDPQLISHPANCKLVKQKDNSTKYIKSTLTIEELILRIENWNKKYRLK